VVFFDDEDIVVGEVAKESAKLYPNEVVSFVKRAMGEADFLFEYNSKTWRAEEISNFVIRKLVQDAEQHLDEDIKDVVITCPAYFGINEREATKRAGEISGLKVHQIINEPTAAAIAYGLVKPSEKQLVLVYDLGGGTFDITLINIQPDSIEVICTGGDHNLGGKDWDDCIVGYLAEEFQKATGTDADILDDADTCQDLQLSAEKAKKMLSQRQKTPIVITHGGERIKIELQREKFEEITQHLLERTISFTHEMLAEAKKKGFEKFDEIILVGGAVRMPMVAESIERELSMKPKIFDPDGAVAKGAAIYGWKLSINDGLVKRIAEKTGESYEAGEEDLDQIIESAPKEVVDEAAEELAKATGYSLPSVHGSKVKITNVTSKSFGVVVKNLGGQEHVFNLIFRNNAVPADVSKTFFTAVDDQDTVLIQIMENEIDEQAVPVDNAIRVGTAKFKLPDGLPSDSPIEIYFNLNHEGRLSITAEETTHNGSVDVEIETSSVIEGDALKEAKARSQSLIVH
jgi:molecular chaperone DnaK (HSP70)